MLRRVSRGQKTELTVKRCAGERRFSLRPVVPPDPAGNPIVRKFLSPSAVHGGFRCGRLLYRLDPRKTSLPSLCGTHRTSHGTVQDLIDYHSNALAPHGFSHTPCFGQPPGTDSVFFYSVASPAVLVLPWLATHNRQIDFGHDHRLERGVSLALLVFRSSSVSS